MTTAHWSKDASKVDHCYAVVRVTARFWIWLFFERVEVRNPQRVPRMGPGLLCINHPNNLIDSLLVGAVLPRKVHHLATGALAFFCSLPLGGLIAYRYLVGTGRLRHQLRFGALLLTRAQEARRLLVERREIIGELERARRADLEGAKGPSA